jgi:hypothetical protein
MALKNGSSLYDLLIFEVTSMTLKQTFIIYMVFYPFLAVNGVKWSSGG